MQSSFWKQEVIRLASLRFMAEVSPEFTNKEREALRVQYQIAVTMSQKGQ